MKAPRVSLMSLVLLTALSAGCGARTGLPVADLDDAALTGVTPDGTTFDSPPSTPLCVPGDPPVAVASGLVWPASVAVDATQVYIALYDPEGSILAVPKVGGAARKLRAANYPESIVLSGGRLFYAESGARRVAAVNVDGSSFADLASVFGVVGVAVDATHVYWADHVYDGSVGRVPRGGGPSITLAPGKKGPIRVAVDDTDLYWTEYYSNEVRAVAKAGGTPRTIARGIDSPVGIAVDADAIYFVDSSGSAYRVEKRGGAMRVLASTTSSTGRAYGRGLALDGPNVYFTSEAAGLVTKVPKVGGASTVIASGADFPDGLALDDSCVYWADTSGPTKGKGKVMRAPK